MADQIATINGVAFGNVAAMNTVAFGNIAAIDHTPFVIDSAIYIVGGTNAKPQISINNAASWADISTGTMSTGRTASQGTSNYKDGYTGAPPNTRKQFLVVGYSGTTSHISRSYDGGVNWDVSMYSGRIYEFSSVCRDASYVYVGEWTYNYYLRSTNWGKSFTESSMPSGFALNFAQSNNGQYVYAGSTNASGSIWKSSNYGVSFALAGTTTTQHKLAACDGSGQYVFAYYASTHSVYFSTNYGTSFTRLNAGALGGQAGMFNDATLFFYTVRTTGDASNGLVYSTNGTSWTKVAYPASWTTADLSYSQQYKRIYISRSTAAPQIYKLNDAKNGWDLVYTLDSNVYGITAASEFRDEVFVFDTSYNGYKITSGGVRTGPIYAGTSVKAIPSIF